MTHARKPVKSRMRMKPSVESVLFIVVWVAVSILAGYAAFQRWSVLAERFALRLQQKECSQ